MKRLAPVRGIRNNPAMNPMNPEERAMVRGLRAPRFVLDHFGSRFAPGVEPENMVALTGIEPAG